MNASDAELELEFAEMMATQHTAPSEPLFWCGYRRGLRRALYGRRFSSNMVHYAWLEFRQETDPILSELARGYIAGIEAVVSGRSVRSSMQSQTDGSARMTEPTKQTNRRHEPIAEGSRAFGPMIDGGGAPVPVG